MRKQAFFRILFTVLLGMLLSFGLLWPLLSFFRLPMLPLYLGICLGTGLFGIFPEKGRLGLLGHVLLLFACMAVLFGALWPLRASLSDLGNAFMLALSGAPSALFVYWLPLGLLLSLACGLTGLSIAVSEGRFLGSFLLFAVLLVLSVLFGGPALPELLPLMAAVILCMKRPEARVPAHFLAVLLPCLLAAPVFLHVPDSVPYLSDKAGTLRQWIDDYLLFSDARTPFSLSALGYMPLGQTRLGGPASPGDAPLLEVRADTPLLLRGTIRDTYTGQGWQDSQSQRRYLLINPRFAALRRNTFDLDHPAATLRARLPEPEGVQVLFLANGFSTLFLTQRFSGLSGQNVVPYFSPASEVFATHSMAAGESYAFDAVPLTGDTQGLRELVLLAAQSEDPWLETVKNSCLSLPDGIDSACALLAESITGQNRTDFDRALSLCTYLRTHFPYTLEQDIPPQGRDFVSWFLFEEQKGYCTSFASAMTVLCRLCGIPARYVEGFSASPAFGQARLTAQNAHAWCEVYFSGFGWVPFDPTPGAGDSDSSQDGAGGGDSPQTETPSPVPSATPEPSPTPDPTPSPAPTDTPEPGSTPAPPPSPTPTVTPLPTPEPPDRDDNPSHLPFLLCLLCLLLMALRVLFCTPAFVAARKKKASDALLVWYLAVLQALEAAGIRSAGEGPCAFLTRAGAGLKTDPPLSDLGQALQVSQYSQRRIGPKTLRRAERIYRSLLHALPLKARLSLLVLRFRRGLSLRQLP